MNIVELEKRLESERIPHHVYSLNGGLPSEAFCLEQLGSKWPYYYSERGYRRNVVYFEREEDACDFLYARIMRGMKSYQWWG